MATTPRQRMGGGFPPREEEREYQDCTFVEAPPGHIQTECPVCKSLLRDPSQVTCCANQMCAACYKKISGSSKQCPICRKSLTGGFSDRNHKRIVEGFRVYCCYRREGCLWTGELSEVEKHLNSRPSVNTRLTGCTYVPVKCGFCHKKVIRSSLDKHERSECPKRRVKCRFCDYVNTHENVNGAHINTCPHIPIDCRYCKNKIRKSDMTSHVALNCPQVPVSCEYEQFGCKDTILRKDMANHMLNSQVTHLKLVKERVLRLQQSAVVFAVVCAAFACVFLLYKLIL